MEKVLEKAIENHSLSVNARRTCNMLPSVKQVALTEDLGRALSQDAHNE